MRLRLGRLPQAPGWRCIIPEDTGELLAADARATNGQALSRFLNLADGLIGQGLNVLLLVTTNELLGKRERPGPRAVGFAS